MKFALNKHLGAEGAMSPGRVQDPEGAKTVVISYATAAGAIAAVIKRMFLITCYTEPDRGRLRVDPALAAGITCGAHDGAKKNSYLRRMRTPKVRPRLRKLRNGNDLTRQTYMCGKHPENVGTAP